MREGCVWHSRRRGGGGGADVVCGTAPFWRSEARGRVGGGEVDPVTENDTDM